MHIHLWKRKRGSYTKHKIDIFIKHAKIKECWVTNEATPTVIRRIERTGFLQQYEILLKLLGKKRI